MRKCCGAPFTRPRKCGLRRLILLPCCMAGPGLAWRTPIICSSTGLGTRVHLTVEVSAACFHPFLEKSWAGWEGHICQK